MPYLYRNAIETSKTGVPMMRSMVLEFTQDKNCAYLDKQYMFGDSLLVAPIFNEESIAKYYLPEGKWTNFLTGEEREGGKWYSEKHGYLSIPLYAREGSIIALGASDNGPVYDYAKDVNYQVYHLNSLSEKSCAVYNTDNQIESELSIQKEDSTYKLKVSGGKPCEITLVNVDNVTILQGGTSTIENGSCVIVPENNEEVIVKLA